MSEPGREPLGMPASSETVAEDDRPATPSPGELTPEQDQEIEDLIDRAEFVVGDSGRALAYLMAKVGHRLERLKEWGPRPGIPSSEDRTPTGLDPDLSPGLIGMEPNSTIKARRPFVGFDREIRAYEHRKPELLASAETRFVVFVGDEMIGPFESHPRAQEAGYSHFGLGPLFIKQVLSEEPVVEVTRFFCS